MPAPLSCALLGLEQPPGQHSWPPQASLLEPYKPQLDALLAKSPDLSAVRLLEEIRRGEAGYTGGISLVRRFKAAVLNGFGWTTCLHPELLAICGHYYREAVPCARRDPESKGMVEAGVRQVRHNALAGREEELTRWEDYPPLAVYCRGDQVANVRLHHTTRARPVDRFQQERPLLRALPTLPFDTDEVDPQAIAGEHAIALGPAR